MDISQDFNLYVAHLSQRLGHADRHAGLSGYCTGLMLPLSRKSVEPTAACADPLQASARRQTLHHFVAKSEWSDTAILASMRDWVIPTLGLDSMTISWNAVTAAASYKVYRNASKTNALPVTATSFNDTDLAAATQYSRSVKAVQNSKKRPHNTYSWATTSLTFTGSN
jgi:hypothetical protein